MKHTGILIILTGCMLVVAGLVFMLADKLPFLGRLPGDIHVRGKHSTFFFPLATCVVLSIALTIVLNIIIRLFFRK
jgi:hypothetical protein